MSVIRIFIGWIALDGLFLLCWCLYGEAVRRLHVRAIRRKAKGRGGWLYREGPPL